MASYNYRLGRKRMESILDNKLLIKEQDYLPIDKFFTFENGCYCWITSIFVDIRNSSVLFANENKETVSKIIRCFSSEIIEILRCDKNLREIGIRGDCVYAIYTTPYQDDVYALLDKTFYINTYMKMLNKLLESRSLPQIKVGIGMSTDKELVIKAGHRKSGINSKVWIGKAVTRASNLSSLGNRNGNPALVYSNYSYVNFKGNLKKYYYHQHPHDWFVQHEDEINGVFYTADILKSGFEKWVINSN